MGHTHYGFHFPDWVWSHETHYSVYVYIRIPYSSVHRPYKLEVACLRASLGPRGLNAMPILVVCLFLAGCSLPGGKLPLHSSLSKIVIHKLQCPCDVACVIRV